MDFSIFQINAFSVDKVPFETDGPRLIWSVRTAEM